MTTWNAEVLDRVKDKQLDNDILIDIADAAEDAHGWMVSRCELGDGFWVIDETEANTIAEAASKKYDEITAWVETLPVQASVASG